MTRPSAVRFSALSLLIVAAVTVGRAQQSRDSTLQPTPVRTGTAALSGRIVTDDASARPVRRATVLLSSGGLSVPQSVVTNDDGTFVFQALPAGAYALQAQKTAYVPAIYGAKRQGRGPGVPIALTEGQTVSNVTLRMARGAVITGTVRYLSGRPADNLQIQVTQVQVVNGQRRPNPDVHAASTDNRGVYRVFGLAAGDYLVLARSMSFVGLFSGSELRQVTAAEVQWAQQAGGAPAPARGQSVGYAPIFFPGAADVSSATVITIGAGEERGGADFVIAPVPTATVTGQVIGADGGPAVGATVSAAAPVDGGMFDILQMALGRAQMPISADGKFTIQNLTPGHYAVTARGRPTSVAQTAPPGGRASPADMLQAARDLLGGGGAATLWGREDILVDGHDIPNVTVRLQPGLTVSGKVVFETAKPPAPEDFTRSQIMLTTISKDTSQMGLVTNMMGALSSPVAADGTFAIKGVIPDRYRLIASNGGLLSLLGSLAASQGVDLPPESVVLKSATWSGHDIADTPVDLKAGVDATGIVVTLTDRPIEISGTVRDATGRPTPNFPIVVFSTNHASWFVGSRRIAQARVSSDGKYRVAGLPAGEYYVAALTDLEPNDLNDPLFLESIAGTAIKITLADGEKKVQDLKLASGG